MNANELVESITPVAYVDEMIFSSDDFVEEGEVDSTIYDKDDQSIIRNFNLTPLYCQEDFLRMESMLRQQQSKIQELEAEVESMKSGGEPVAWMTEWKYKGVTCREVTFEIQQRGSTAIHTQLFTRPTKYLQDEDLEECHKAAWRK